jgi:hypothetical protein
MPIEATIGYIKVCKIAKEMLTKLQLEQSSGSELRKMEMELVRGATVFKMDKGSAVTRNQEPFPAWPNPFQERNP